MGAMQRPRGAHHHACAGLVSFSLLSRSFLLLAPPDGRSSAHALAMGAAPSFLCACIGVLVYSVGRLMQRIDLTLAGSLSNSCIVRMLREQAGRVVFLTYTQPHSAFFPQDKTPKSSLPPPFIPCSVNYRDFVSSLAGCNLELMLLWCHCAASLLIGPPDASIRFGTCASPCLSTAAPLPTTRMGISARA
ncbi:hypothetical protein B0H14DRAFT_501420 [Mycena olivaceomarginata]|nr:hypothetical protein B0H14DRAFT_501420 [Mycena olivaceomarginata]